MCYDRVMYDVNRSRIYNGYTAWVVPDLDLGYAWIACPRRQNSAHKLEKKGRRSKVIKKKCLSVRAKIGDELLRQISIPIKFG